MYVAGRWAPREVPIERTSNRHFHFSELLQRLRSSVLLREQGHECTSWSLYVAVVVFLYFLCRVRRVQLVQIECMTGTSQNDGVQLSGLRQEVKQVEQSCTSSMKPASNLKLMSASTSSSTSEDEDSDAYESDGPESQAGESVGSSKDNPEAVLPTKAHDDDIKPLECFLSSSINKKDRAVGGLVASNDFFTPRPNLPRSASSNSIKQSSFSFDGGDRSFASSHDVAMRRIGEVDPHPDSLRSRYSVKSTPRQTSVEALKANFGTPQMGTPRLMTPRDASNCSVGYIIKERVNNFTKRIQQSYNTERRVCRSGRSVSARDLELQLLEHGMTPVYQPEIWATQPPPKAITDISDVRSFLGRPAPEGCAPIQCFVQRQYKADWIFPRFKMYLQEGNQMHFILSARKRKKSMSSNYIMSLDADDISRRTGNYFGKLRSNFFGTEFWFYDKGARPKLGRSEASHSRRVELGAVTYQNNPLGLQGPRKMIAIIPALTIEKKPYIHEPGPAGSHSLLTKYKCGQDLHKMVIMRNKDPAWNNKKMCYALNFNGRVSRPSVKNFQLTKDEDPGNIILQFGKAFAIALSSLDKKIACE
ncbi:hypothetical protein Mp_6g12440 [Marchantia polymorpha subsp. ruderalis]|uniref:Tubby C-terminal domain-containing protein n=4 Tax=Marchantia polymorpha TaxID=3197 RepID=A0AAF6BR86_MARPO|nr:hypothetical protein MARPO_0059s0102 [Marchantia polymorpha]BBN14520.1 hypothetical protein Mp_6g12440 [Marchantia polymorpha subsp. ruderalis]|eukprot:PTQ37197.1 hypothetical protein MARPO_0059s0102 [Marchantia polymorpha]